MAQKPSYKELEQKVKELEDEISRIRAADKRRAIERRHLAEDILRGKPEAEEALRESENRYKRLVEGSPDVVYIYSDKRGESFWSQRVGDILGFSPDDLRERPFLWHDSIHPDDLSKVDSAIEGSKKGEDFDIEYRIKDMHENWHWFHDRIIGKHQAGDETIIEGLATDITSASKLRRRCRRLITPSNSRWQIVLSSLRKQSKILRRK